MFQNNINTQVMHFKDSYAYAEYNGPSLKLTVAIIAWLNSLIFASLEHFGPDLPERFMNFPLITYSRSQPRLTNVRITY